MAASTFLSSSGIFPTTAALSLLGHGNLVQFEQPYTPDEKFIHDKFLSATQATPPLPDTSLNRRMFAIGAAMRGREIGFDLDKTVVDCTVENRESGKFFQIAQIKPGAEAFISGLLVHNRVMLVTSAHAYRIAKIFRAFPFLAHLFTDCEGTARIDAQLIMQSPRIFCYEDLISALEKIAESSLRKDPLSDAEAKISREVLKAKQEDSRRAAHIKSPHLTRLAGKGSFDVLVDDDALVVEIAARLDDGIAFIKTPARKRPKEADGLDLFMDNTMLLVASALLAFNSQEIEINSLRRVLNESPMRAKVVLRAKHAFRPEEPLDAVVHMF